MFQNINNLLPMSTIFHTKKHLITLTATLLMCTVSVSAQTIEFFSAEKTISLFAGTSMNLGRSFSTDNEMGSPTYSFDHQDVHPGLALNFSYAWFKDIGDWLYSSFQFTIGIQQDNYSASFKRNDNAQLETFDNKRTLLNITAAYRLGLDIAEHWQLFAGLGPFARTTVKKGITSGGFESGIEAELSLYYQITHNLCCSFQARYDVLGFNSLINGITGNQTALANGAYIKSNGNALLCMIGIGYRY